MKITIADIDAATPPLRDLEATLEAELKAAESQKPTPTTRNLPFELRTTLRQLRDGLSFNEGTDPRVWAVLNSEQMQRFRFRAPGLAPLDRLRAKLLAEQQAAENPPVASPLLKFRYTEPPWKFKVAGGRWNTGDVLQLTADAARAYGDKLEPVRD